MLDPNYLKDKSVKKVSLATLKRRKTQAEQSSKKKDTDIKAYSRKIKDIFQQEEKEEHPSPKQKHKSIFSQKRNLNFMK